MRALVAIAAAEIRQRWTVFPAALVAGLLALLVPLFSALGRHDIREARALAALVFAAAFAFGVAAFVGGETINRELSERRHGFLFARPLPAAAIWGGKMLACWVLALGSGAVALLPAVIAARGVRLLGSVAPWRDAAATFGVAAILVLAVSGWAHAVVLMVRSHAPLLLALDAALAVAVAAPLAFALRSLALAYAVTALLRAGVVVAAAVLIAPLAAGLVQVSVGRTSMRRGHAALSATLWGILGVTAVAVATYTAWLRSAGPEDLRSLSTVVCAPRGSWAFVSGEGRGRGDYQASFLLDAATGRSLAIGAAGKWWLAGTFSADGSRAVWLAPPAGVSDRVRTLMTADLAARLPQPLATPIVVGEGWGHLLGLSPDGRRIALLDGGVVSACEVESGGIVASARAPSDAGAVRAVWLSPASLRLLAWNPDPANADSASLRLFEFDLARKTLTETGRLADVSRRGFWFMTFDPERGLLLTRTGTSAAGAIVLVDGRTGARIATLAPCDGTFLFRATFLSGGRVAVASADGGEGRLMLFSAAGTPERTLQLGPAHSVSLAAQPTADTLIVTTRLRRADSPESASRALIVNLDAGSVTPLGDGLRSLAWYPWRDGVVAPEPGSFASRAFLGVDGRLTAYEPGRGTLRAVLQARFLHD